MKAISSIKDPLIVEARALNKPAARGQRFLLEGEQALRWAIEADVDIQHIFVSPKYQNSLLLEQLNQQSIDIYQCSDGIMKKINDSSFLSPIIAVAAITKTTLKHHSDFVLTLENIQDQGNLGTLVRTACALGVRQLCAVGMSCDMYNRKTINASRGTCFHVRKNDFAKIEDVIAYLREKGYQIIATSPRGRQLQSNVELQQKPVALIVGNETEGVSDAVFAAADAVVQIPMSTQIESINVGVAAGISLYEIKLKGIIAMLSENIRKTLGRSVGVSHQLMQTVLHDQLQAVSNLSAIQVRLLMIMVCNVEMSRQQIENDVACSSDELSATLEVLLSEGYILQLEQDKYKVSEKGEATLGKLWSVVERSEEVALQGFSDDEKRMLFGFMSRIQDNCG